MYKFYLKNVKKAHQYEELIKTFIKAEDFIIVLDCEDKDSSNGMSWESFAKENIDIEKEWTFEFLGDKNLLKKELFETLINDTDKRPSWGIITGIRPIKLFGEITANGEDAEEVFRSTYCVSDEKIRLSSDIYTYQKETFGVADKKSVGLYIGIPFCPTRCTYCSFTSNQVIEKEKEKYLNALIREIEGVSESMKEKGIFPESIYVGGGTPTTLDEKQLERLLGAVTDKLIDERLVEFTVEAGRADTITEEKIKILIEKKVDRISINPQSMRDKTLKRIGRQHTSQEVENSFKLGRKLGSLKINADLIAGLPGENLEDFKFSLNEIIKLNAENITIHTLAIKRSSELSTSDKDCHYNQDVMIAQMFQYGYERLKEAGYRPYYLYRQKNMSGAGENVGFCKVGSEGLYNVRIMDEHQTIVALGAGGISKAYFPEEDRLERVPNVSNYEVYIDRVDEMIKRKREKVFKEG